ncbi:MAG: hypothetical protein RLZZ308_739 [Candidatus Parcubacteria bacterium]|jgi:LemA protein
MKNKVFIVGVVIVVVIAFYCMATYNGFVRREENVTTAWAQVETQYQRRYDLVPNLVSSVQGVMKQETAIFTAIANARQGYAGARTTEEKVAAASSLESSLSRLLVITENYPVLKSSDNVQALMAQLEGTENRISVERGRYNEAVQEYNIAVRSFPGNTFASLFGFTIKHMFEADSSASSAPKVDLSQ